MSIEICHTAEDGTLVHGTNKGDGTNVILKASGFRWFRTLGLWGIPGSRDRQPNIFKIDRAAAALRAAGHEVTVNVDSNHRPAAEAEADRAQRQQDRADALAAKADRRSTAARPRGTRSHAPSRRCHLAVSPSRSATTASAVTAARSSARTTPPAARSTPRTPPRMPPRRPTPRPRPLRADTARLRSRTASSAWRPNNARISASSTVTAG